MAENVAARLAQAKLVTKAVADPTKKTDFNDKLKDINKKLTSNKTRYLEINKKLDDAAKKLKLISTKG